MLCFLCIRSVYEVLRKRRKFQRCYCYWDVELGYFVVKEFLVKVRTSNFLVMSLGASQLWSVRLGVQTLSHSVSTILAPNYYFHRFLSLKFLNCFHN